MIVPLNRDGHCPAFVEPGVAAALRLTLVGAPAFTGHVIPQGDRVERSLPEAWLASATCSRGRGLVCHRMADVLRSPGLFEMVARGHDLAQAYFGEEPVLYSVNAFWKTPLGAPGWHYDEDDRWQLVMFMYGTDVLTASDGVHAYVTGSHLWERATLRPFHNVQEDVSGPLPPAWPVHSFYGQAGLSFFTDTRGLHNGLRPVATARLLLWARWGVSTPPKTYAADELAAVPWQTLGLGSKPPEIIQRRTRFVVDWS